MSSCSVPWIADHRSVIGKTMLAMLLVVTLPACQSISLGTTKSEDYHDKVERLAVLYLARPQVDVEAMGTGAFVKPVQEEAQRWLKVGEFDQFADALGEAVPKAFEKYAVPASFERVERLPATLDGYAGKHVLVIDPFMVMVGTISGGAYVALSLHDPARSGFVWQSTSMIVIDLVGHPGASGARPFMDKTAAALKSAQLLPSGGAK